MALSFDCQETKSDAVTLGKNRPKYTLNELRRICTQIEKNICRIKTTAEVDHF